MLLQELKQLIKVVQLFYLHKQETVLTNTAHISTTNKLGENIQTDIMNNIMSGQFPVVRYYSDIIIDPCFGTAILYISC